MEMYWFCNCALYTCALLVVLILLGAYEVAFNRTKRTFRGLVSGAETAAIEMLSLTNSSSAYKKFLVMFITLLLCICTIGILGTVFALKMTPFWAPEKFIPIIGMLLGNVMSTVAMASERCLDHVRYVKRKRYPFNLNAL